MIKLIRLFTFVLIAMLTLAVAPAMADSDTTSDGQPKKKRGLGGLIKRIANTADNVLDDVGDATKKAAKDIEKDVVKMSVDLTNSLNEAAGVEGKAQVKNDGTVTFSDRSQCNHGGPKGKWEIRHGANSLTCAQDAKKK